MGKLFGESSRDQETTRMRILERLAFASTFRKIWELDFLSFSFEGRAMDKEKKTERNKALSLSHPPPSWLIPAENEVIPESTKKTWTSGIERLVREATADKDFHESLLADPLQAAEKVGIQLTEAEKTMLRTIKPFYLEAVITMTTNFGFERAIAIQPDLSGAVIRGTRPD